MIPKIIHYCWFGSKKLSSLEKACIASWRQILPEYRIICWNEKNFDISMYEFSKQAYHYKKYAFVADVCRIHVLNELGGIYLDTDVVMIKTFNPLLKFDKMILGMENKKLVSTACIISPNSNIYLDKLLEYYKTTSFINEKGNLNITPNTKLISNMLEEELNISFNHAMRYESREVLILPKDYFSPKDFKAKYYKTTVNTYCVHHFNASWRPFKMILKEAIVELLPSKVLQILTKIMK